jgi:cell division protein YceG involved in septum cleavage
MKGKKRKNRKRYNFFLVILILVLLLAVYMLNELTEAASEVSREVRITIPAGSSNQEIARILAEHKIIKNKFAFLLYSKYLGYDRSLKAVGQNGT